MRNRLFATDGALGGARDFVSWDRPLFQPCPQCGAAFVVQKVSRAGLCLRCLADGCGWTAEPDAEADAPAAPDAKAS